MESGNGGNVEKVVLFNVEVGAEENRHAYRPFYNGLPGGAEGENEEDEHAPPDEGVEFGGCG